jgi:outer membrane receptor protein involved in Fe transport
MIRSILLLLVFTGLSVSLPAQLKTQGTIQGTILDNQTGAPVEYANVALIDTTSGKLTGGTITDSSGHFRLTGIPAGIYRLEYSFIGYAKQKSKPFTISRKENRVDAGILGLTPAATMLNDATVTAERSMIINRIDRKIFNVQQDITAQTGTVTDVLQNIPAVSVDMDGNVSLRGSGNVTILINGRPSAMAGAESLDQMPASLIERIEVITNPSAKYRPDGTAGIINIILKKNHKAGFNGSVGGNIGNNDRYNTNIQLNLSTSRLNIFGSYGYRKDYRWRSSDLYSRTTDTSGRQSVYLDQHSEGYARPVSNLGTLGADWNIGNNDVTGVSGTINYRSLDRINEAYNLYRDDSLHTSEEFTRYQSGPDYETSLEANAYYEHTINRESEHRFRTDFSYEQDDEHENYTYTTVYHMPQYPNGGDYNYNHILDAKINMTMIYSRPLWKNASMETGYEGNMEISDQDFQVQHYSAEAAGWTEDSILTNRFKGNQTVHALFGTLSCSIKKFSFMAGIRPELALLDLHFLSVNSSVNQTYFAVYPTLHLSLESGKNEWQLNYSHRVNRPETEDMNPVPEYRDPRNYFVGNPDLKPEEIHSFEFGYSVRSGPVNLIPAVFYRYRRNGFTTVTNNLNDSVLVTTMTNLAHGQSAGIDFSGNAAVAQKLNLNFSASGFYDEIDASNIGYSSHKAAFSWNAKLNASVSITNTTVLQANGQYRSSLLTPQGTRYPTWNVNAGVRQDFLKKKLSVLVTISDIFNSNASKSTINTAVLEQQSVRRRDGPVFYCGAVFKFSSNNKSKKEKEPKFEFDNSPE